jgi:Rod binding domain-containing protein
MGAISLLQTTNLSEAPNSPHARVLKAGAQFEAVLLNNVLGAVEHVFTKLPGRHDHQSTEAYSGLAMQTLASKLAEGGGIGLGRLLAKALEKHSEPASQNPLQEELKLFNAQPMSKLQGERREK